MVGHTMKVIIPRKSIRHAQKMRFGRSDRSRR